MILGGGIKFYFLRLGGAPGCAFDISCDMTNTMVLKTLKTIIVSTQLSCVVYYNRQKMGKKLNMRKSGCGGRGGGCGYDLT